MYDFVNNSKAANILYNIISYVFHLWPMLILPGPLWAMFTMITAGENKVKSSTARIFQRGLSGSVVIFFHVFFTTFLKCFLNIWFIRTEIYVLYWNRSLVNTIEYKTLNYSFLLFPHCSLYQYIFLHPLGNNKTKQQEHRKKIMRQYSFKGWQG